MKSRVVREYDMWQVARTIQLQLKIYAERFAYDKSMQSHECVVHLFTSQYATVSVLWQFDKCINCATAAAAYNQFTKLPPHVG